VVKKKKKKRDRTNSVPEIGETRTGKRGHKALERGGFQNGPDGEEKKKGTRLTNKT